MANGGTAEIAKDLVVRLFGRQRRRTFKEFDHRHSFLRRKRAFLGKGVAAISIPHQAGVETEETRPLIGYVTKPFDIQLSIAYPKDF